jgi:hypothetical protein
MRAKPRSILPEKEWRPASASGLNRGRITISFSRPAVKHAPKLDAIRFTLRVLDANETAICIDATSG